MKVKIIKRGEREKEMAAVTVSAGQTSPPKPVESRKAMTTTVNAWIDELRQKRESERLLFQKLFNEKYCS